jgi:hypothetical protein
MKLGTALKAGVIALALQEALVTGRQVHFTKQGRTTGTSSNITYVAASRRA